MPNHSSTLCPCGTGLPYISCCAALHQGASAASPEALMRSRYSAFALGQLPYLLQSWHPDTRPASLAPEPAVRWRRLEIEEAPAPRDDQGLVRFRATRQEAGHWYQLAELSRFTRIGEHWLYRDGDCTLSRLTPGRNDPCPCGSGRKLKHCCTD